MVGFLTYFRQFLIIFIISALIGCHSSNAPKTADSTGENKTTIELFSSSLHRVKLPFIDTCFDTVAVQRPSIPDSLASFKKYGQVIGLLNETPDYVAILFSVSGDIQLPVLRTFTHKGELIATQKLYIGNCCGENEDCSGLSTVRITTDLNIILKDSAQTFVRDKKKYDKKSNIKIEVKSVDFSIENDGTIKKHNPPAA